MNASLKTFAVLASLAALALSAQADTLTLSVKSAYSGNDGIGAYLATPKTGAISNADYTGNAKISGGGFLTFCVEHNEYFEGGESYNYVVSNGAVNGGVKGQTSPNYDGISNATAYLYSQFAQGLLNVGGFAYNETGYSLLQNAIWYLENELVGTNALANYAKGQVGVNWNADSNGSYGVQALNLTYATDIRGTWINEKGTRAQDQLYYHAVAVPDQGMTVALLGFSLLGLVAFRRRFGSAK